MKTKALCTILVLLLFSAFQARAIAAEKVTTIEGSVTGQVICYFEWVKDPAYQGSNAVCPNANHDRSLVTKNGEVYILEPDDKAGPDVVKLVRTPSFERKKILVSGEILKKDGINIIKVKSFKVEE